LRGRPLAKAARSKFAISSHSPGPFGEVDAEREYFEALRPSLEQGYGGTFDRLDAFLLQG
jgi:hypothetical protein